MPAKDTKKKKTRKVIKLDRDEPDSSKRAYKEQFNIAKASHPIACLFQIGFKIASCSAFLFMSLFTYSNVKVFITTMLLVCLDFWVTKNVTGRHLLGLRWWTSGELTEDDVIGNLDGVDQKEEDEDVGTKLKKLEEIATRQAQDVEVVESNDQNQKSATAKQALKKLEN